MSKNIDENVDKLEAAVAPDTVISIGGYSFTPAKLMIAGGIISSILGGLYGAFEVYKDYQNMKEAIQTYVAPDLSELNKKIELAVQNTDKTLQFTNEIKNDLKQDIRRLEGVVEQVERSSKQLQRETLADVKDMRDELRDTRKEVERDLRNQKAELEKRIRDAVDNPLATK
jgi:peptidoglycan hydrolase CwlO-like protein